jgi:polyisoprenoid-binding protein YceI
MKGVKGDVNASFTFNASGHIASLNALNVTIPSNSIKSEHSAMDKKAYKSLKTDQNPNITFSLISATVLPIDAANYTVKSFGKLSIAGVTKEVEITSTCKVNADKSITVSGSRKISMKDYSMESPSWLFVKTGDEIVLKFDLTIKK